MTDKPKITSMDIPLYMEYLRDEGRSESTVFVYSKAIQSFLFENPDITNLNHYNDFLMRHIIKKRSSHYHDAIRKFIEYKFKGQKQWYSVKRDLIDNLIRKKIYQPKKQTKYMDDESRANVINAIKDDKHKCLAMLQNVLGVRVGDLLRLEKGKIYYQLYDGHMVMKLDIVAKGGRPTPKWIFDESTMADLDYFIKNYHYDDQYYFLDRSKSRPGSNINTITRTNYKWYWDDLKNALSLIGISFEDFSSHDFRRCSGRKVWDKYKDPETLRRFFGHRDIETSIRYLRLSGLGEADIHKEMQLGE